MWSYVAKCYTCEVIKNTIQRLSSDVLMSKTFVNAKDSVIPTHFQRVLFRALIDKGISSASLLRGLNFQEEFLDDEFRLTFDQHSIFIKNALSATDDPHLGWRFGRHINITALGLLGYAIMAAENGAAAVRTLTRFFKLRAPSYDLTLLSVQQNAESAVLQINETFDFGEVRYFMLSCIVSAFDHVFKSFNREANVIERVEFGCEEPSEWHQEAGTVNYPVVFGLQTTKLFLDTSFLTRPLPTADPYTEKTTTQICQEMLSRAEGQSGIIREVNELILNCSGNYPSLTDAATHLCMSPRTLRRELQKSNTTYQQMLDNTRSTIAKKLLLNTTKTTSEIGYELGFRDTSNFNRAFKKWTGVSPGQFRK